MGLYDDPYSKFGYLDYQMWRAVRLVVDTGIHSEGWTRAQALRCTRFNIKNFHAAVLEHGALPLTVLDQVVDRSIDSQRRSPTEAATAN